MAREAMAALEAISLAGGRSLGRVGWADAAERLQQHSVLGLLVVEAEDVPDVTIAAVLPHVEAFARAIDARIVVSSRATRSIWSRPICSAAMSTCSALPRSPTGWQRSRSR